MTSFYNPSLPLVPRITNKNRVNLFRLLVFPVLVALIPTAAHALGGEDWLARFQTTYVWQAKPGFSAAYSGERSLRNDRERSYSLTATLFLGHRLWHGAEFHVDPEMALGLPLSQLTGLAGFNNAELTRTSGREPTFYRARLFFRQTINLSGERTRLDADDLQLASDVQSRRLVFTGGNLSALDIFDDNSFSHDPRTNFLNWTFLTHGAWDFPADARGYTWGVASEYFHDDWTLRLGRFLMPKESNGLKLNFSIANSYGDVIELERRHHLFGQAGAVRLLAFRNQAAMGSYRDALNNTAAGGDTPTLEGTRDTRAKRGVGINIEQQLGPSLGVFARASRNNGRAETFAFTEIDSSMSGGVVIEGHAWGRTRDALGIAVARNGISRDHREYLAAGGQGFFLGDGRLSYSGEYIFETYYAIALTRAAVLTVDYQHIAHPAYNRDRGPVNLYGVRIRAAF